MSDEVDIELEDEESGDDEVSSVKKAKPAKAPVDKLKEEFEDLAVSIERSPTKPFSRIASLKTGNLVVTILFLQLCALVASLDLLALLVASVVDLLERIDLKTLFAVQRFQSVRLTIS